MAINWDYKKEENEYKELEIGNYRVRIAEAVQEISKSGKDMIKLVLEVSGTLHKLWYYIVFLPENAKMTNKKLTQLFDSFGIGYGDFVLANWVGKVGACRVKHDEEGKARVHYFIDKSGQTTLPAWEEPKSGSGTPSGIQQPVLNCVDDDLPF